MKDYTGPNATLLEKETFPRIISAVSKYSFCCNIDEKGYKMGDLILKLNMEMTILLTLKLQSDDLIVGGNDPWMSIKGQFLF